MIAVGCFAAGATLKRVLRKAVEDYIMGKWDDFQSAGILASEGSRVLDRLMAPEAPLRLENRPEPVTGFQLAFKNQQLNLRVFSKNARSLPRTFSLEELTRLRRQRLN